MPYKIVPQPKGPAGPGWYVVNEKTGEIKNKRKAFKSRAEGTPYLRALWAAERRASTPKA